MAFVVAVFGGPSNFDTLIQGHINNDIYKILVLIFSLLSMLALLCGITRFSEGAAVFFYTINGAFVGALMTVNMAKWYDGSMPWWVALPLSLGLFASLEFIGGIKRIKEGVLEPKGALAIKYDNILNGIAIILTLAAMCVFYIVYQVKIMPTIGVS